MVIKELRPLPLCVLAVNVVRVTPLHMCHCLYLACMACVCMVGRVHVWMDLCSVCSLSSPSEPVGEVTQRAHMALSTFTDDLAWCIRSYRHVFVHVQFVLVHALWARKPPRDASMHDHARVLHVWSSPRRYNVLNHAMHPCTREARVYHAANPRPPHPPPCTLACLAHGSCHVCREIGLLQAGPGGEMPLKKNRLWLLLPHPSCMDGSIPCMMDDITMARDMRRCVMMHP